MNFGKISYLPLILLLNGCSIPLVSAPVWFEAISYTRTAYDAASFVSDEPTTTELALSAYTDKNCRMSNVIRDADVCAEKSVTEKIRDYIARNLDELNAN